MEVKRKLFYWLDISNFLYIIVLLILAGVTISALTGENGILTQAMKAKEKTEEANKKEEEDLNKMLYIMSGEDTSGANYPVMKEEMKKVYWKEDGTEVKEGEEGFEISKWYNYKEQNGRTDTWKDETQEWGSSHWANAILDGNYYVWIPRYAYKIDESVTYTSQEGGISHKIDVKFLSGTSNQAPEGYIVHPAFTFGGQELEGIWVGKYETTGTKEKPTILPNEKSLKNVNVATMFETAQKLSKTNIDAHMMKNIEWGAVAYLTQSQYGRNGTEVSVNQCIDMYTGTGRGGTEKDKPIYNSTYTWDNIQEIQKYNGKIGKLSSTTGNIYGIYDMSGGAHDRVMAFYQDSQGHIHTGNSTSSNSGFNGYLADGNEYTGGTNLPNEKYYDLYKNETNSNKDYSSGKNGDATKEVVSWNNTDNRLFINSFAPIFDRGGCCDQSNNCGIFYCMQTGAPPSGTASAHICLAVE